MAQQHLGPDNQQRLAEVARHLPAQGVEVLRRSGRIHDVQVHVVPCGRRRGGGGSGHGKTQTDTAF